MGNTIMACDLGRVAEAPRNAQIGVRLTMTERSRLEQLARENSITASDFVRYLINSYEGGKKNDRS